MDDSILSTTKQICQIDSEYTAFDLDVMTHINMAFATLNQIGIGPVAGYAITGIDEKWSDYEVTTADVPEKAVWLSMVKSYVYLKVRLIFDPPGTSYLLASTEKQIAEMESRLNTFREVA